MTRASLTASNRARAFLEQYYHIVDEPLALVGWQLGADTILQI